MNIQVPWKMRLRREGQAVADRDRRWPRSKKRAASTGSEQSGPPREQDLDHLGSLHLDSR